MKQSLPQIATGFNKVLDQATALDPAMPVLLSPFYSEYLTNASVTATLPFWQTFLNAAHLRDGDIFCPQDAIGAAWTRETSLEKVWKMYAAAVKSAAIAALSSDPLWQEAAPKTSAAQKMASATFTTFFIISSDNAL